MTNFNNSFEHFSKTYEYNQNKFIFRIILWFLIAIPFFLLGKMAGIFPQFDYPVLIIDVCVFVAGYLSAYILEKIRPYSPLIKYIILITVELDIIIVSVGSGTLVYISYIIIPLISCIYLNRKFSIRILIICFVLMIVSLFVRAYYIVPGYTSGISSRQWLIQYVVICSIEYFVNAFIVLILATRNASIVDTDYQEVVKKFNSQREITSSYVAMLSQKHSSLEKHLVRCSNYIDVICRNMQRDKKYSDILTDDMIFNYVTASYLHDVGVMSIPDSILNKKTELTDKEMDVLKTHTIFGYNLIKENLSEMDRDYLEVLCDMSLYHHERWDGNGYPYKLSGLNIPLAGRVMAAVNTLDNLLTDAPYRKAVSFDEMLEKITQMEGNELDPDIVKIIIKAAPGIRQVYENQNK